MLYKAVDQRLTKQICKISDVVSYIPSLFSIFDKKLCVFVCKNDVSDRNISICYNIDIPAGHSSWITSCPSHPSRISIKYKYVTRFVVRVLAVINNLPWSQAGNGRNFRM